jgi:hypothetical protein
VENSGVNSIEEESPMTDVTTDAALRAAGQPPRLVRFAVDSDNLDMLFPADFVRTYADLVDQAGLASLRARFPDSVIELIDRGLGDPTGTANIYDVEPGALSPAQAADRVRAGHAAGQRWQLVYSDQADLDAVMQACERLTYWHWIAAFGQLIVPTHRSAQIQFASAEMLAFHADLSIVWDPAYRPAPGTAALLARATQAAESLAGGLGQPAAAALGTALAVPAAEGHESLSGDVAARLRAVLATAKAQHGTLAVLERDLAALPGLVAEHAGLLAELAHLV